MFFTRKSCRKHKRTTINKQLHEPPAKEGEKYLTKLSDIRISKGLTQIKLARMLKVATSTVGMWEQGRRSPNLFMVNRLAEIYGCDTDTIISASLNTKSTDPPQHKQAPPTRDDVIQAFANLLDVASAYLVEKAKEARK